MAEPTTPTTPTPSTSSSEDIAAPSVPVARTHDLATGVTPDVTATFEELANEFLAEDDIPVSAVPVTKSSAEVTPPAVSPTVTPTPDLSPVTPPVNPAVQTPAPEATPAATPPVVPAEPVAKTAQEVQLEFDKAEERLANEYYKISSEDASLILSEPEKALPKYMAKVHMSVLQTTMAALATHMPQIIESVNRNTEAWKEGTQQFYDTWPALKDPTLMPGIRRLAETYVSLHPSTDLPTRIKEIGVQAHMLYRIPLPGTANAPTPAPTPTPYRPPTGGSGSPSAKGPPSNQFTQLAEELLMEDG